MTRNVLVVHPALLFRHDTAKVPVRDAEAALQEALGLAAAIDLKVVHAEIIRLKTVAPATLLGAGAVERLASVIAETDPELIFIDTALTPVQQRNLEKTWNRKVIDRTGLILEIFGARARTREGRLQVDLAALQYQRTRLVKAWSHLERQRGGGGFLGGPGETQKELDRRALDDRIRKLKDDLEGVRRNRCLQRESRKREPYPIIALVGYTNAGKSTLFNRLTGAEVFAKDLLFATLDTTMRALRLPSGTRAILSDTVGFISALPTHLVAAFRATLEEVQDAAVILHIRDISQDSAEAEKQDVLTILNDLGIAAEDERLIEVLNKVDLLSPAARRAVETRSRRTPRRVPVSAAKGEGMKQLLEAIDERLGQDRHVLCADIPLTDGKALAWLYRRGEILEREDGDETARLRVAIAPAEAERFRAQFPHSLTKTRRARRRKASVSA